MAKRKIQELTTGVHDFESLIKDKTKKYVDKTDILYELALEKTDAQYFISRPRRFGKSLMLSTLQAMFEGRRDLFKGLEIYDLPWEGWTEPTPVYSFSMSKVNALTFEKLEAALAKLVRGLCEIVKLEYDNKVEASVNFGEFLKVAAEKSPTKKIVVLIDEYDEPIAGFLDDLEALRLVRKTLHDFYEKLKDNSKSIRFLMMTGVTKLTKLSVFSGLTHLTDLSASPRFATLLGYTHSEIDGALRENVEALAKKLGQDFESTRDKILKWFDGYRFSPQTEARVVNPVSLGKLFGPDGGEFKSYWETTGGSTLIFNRIKAVGKMPDDLENVRVRPIQLDVCDAETLPIEALLYQSGYLTIKEVFHSDKPEDKGVAATDTYRLAPPNEEIRHSLRDGYVSRILGFPDDSWETLIDRARRLIASGDIREVVETMLFSLYAQVPPDWRIANEAEAKRYFQLFFAMLGADP
ncbi:MAG: AAA family ATPase, partial [Kiritimatiellae bacterium]|nr:AAA family ATPase [Kiritimatiellia bacterium]